ncbi:MAG: hypothetical protein ACE5OR_07020 [bacterium]
MVFSVGSFKQAVGHDRERHYWWKGAWCLWGWYAWYRNPFGDQPEKDRGVMF